MRDPFGGVFESEIHVVVVSNTRYMWWWLQMRDKLNGGFKRDIYILLSVVVNTRNMWRWFQTPDESCGGFKREIYIQKVEVSNAR